MNSRKGFSSNTHCASSDNCTESSTSNYSTCSDDLGHTNTRIKNAQISRQSVILAGKMSSQDSVDESDYSVNVFEKNIDTLTEEDIFEDCNEASKSESNKDDSTEYMPLECASNLPEIKSNNHLYKNYLDANDSLSNNETNELSDSMPVAAEECQGAVERLVTIMEETEVTYTPKSIVLKNNSPINYNNTGDLVVNMVEKLKNYEKCSKPSRDSHKRVFFANDDNIINDNQENNRTDMSTSKKNEKVNSIISKNQCFVGRGKDINENTNNHFHNNTESFVLWEKYLESSENVAPRRSLSFSELNSITESYGGDDEYSTTFKTLDETYLSNSSETIYVKKNSQQKSLSHRSKSCDDLLKEVKHLPHMIYQRFLKCLSKEIDNMLKQNIVCTCQRPFKKRTNKENDRKDIKYIKHIHAGSNEKKNNTKDHKTLQVSPLRSIINESKLTPQRQQVKSPLKSLVSESRLTPDRLLINSSKNHLRLSPKSPNKTPTKKHELYSWRKEIVSPVGEYIRGKRQSPFKSSPSKKKV